MDFQAILNDKSTFGDDIELNIGTEKVSLGQLRELTAKQQRELSAKMSAADEKQREAVNTATKAADLLAKLEEAKTKIEAARTTAPTDDDFDKSEWWEPVRKRFTDRDAKIDQALKGIETLQQSVAQAATIWAKDRWQNQFERNAPRLKKVEAYKDWDYDKVLGYATQNKIVDGDGMPSVEKAILELTKANEIETIRREEYERGLQAGKNKARMDSMPRPSSATGGKVQQGKSAVEEFGLEGLGDDVAADADLMEQISKISDITLQ